MAWMVVGEALGREDWLPNQEDTLADWLCTRCVGNVTCTKDLRAVLLLVMWELWKHHNAIVFDGDSPSIARLINKVKTEAKVWATAGLIKTDLEGFLGRLHRWAMREE